MIKFNIVKNQTKITIYSKKLLSVSNLTNDFKLNYKLIHKVYIRKNHSINKYETSFLYKDILDEFTKSILIAIINDYINT